MHTYIYLDMDTFAIVDNAYSTYYNVSILYTFYILYVFYPNRTNIL